MKAAGLLFVIVAAAIGQSYADKPQVQYPNAGTLAPVLVTKVAAVYTPQARQAGIEGTVRLSVHIGTDGRAHDIRVIEGLGYGLDTKAVDAVRQWRFRPGMKDGAPVVIAANIEVEFRLAEAGLKPIRV
jgi:TonB family protein